MLKLYENCFHTSFKTFCLLILILYTISEKCINCLSLQESVAAAYTSTHGEQIELKFSILEGVPIGTLIGVIKSSNSSITTQPPYLIVPVPGGSHKFNSSSTLSSGHSANGGGGVDTDLNIDQSTGEIRTAVQLDREQRSYYTFIAIPLTGANIRVTVTIEDINDNSPQFPTDEIDLEFPENSKPRDVKRTLPPARDLDLGQFGTQKYRIVSGNIGNAFRLLSHRERDDVLYLDLQVNGALDRETISGYTLVIEALDGGQPQLRDEMTVRISILDHNDCEPVFSQSHYYGNVAENVTLGTSLLRVTATDNDQGDNGLITYSIHSKNSALSGLSTYFGINKNNGWIFVAKPLDFESKEIHELVVIARDSGAQPLETSAFVSIRVTDVNDNQPTISLLFLTENARPEIPENAKIGDLVARVSVNDADSSDIPITSETNGDPINGLSVSLAGNDGNFGLTTQDNVIYLIVVTGPLDRETKSKYTLIVIVTDQGSPPLNTTTSFELDILDINDNPPHFESDTYHVTLPEAADIGSSVFRAKALDPDSDSQISYSFVEKNFENISISKWFAIDSKSGLITTQSQVDCETDPTPKLIILATDTSPIRAMGSKGFSATATLIVSISDINDNEPIFDQSFYNITVREDEPIGNCILKISASDPDCGFNAIVNYTTMNTVMSIMATNINAYQQDFTIHPITGQLCIARQLDYESRNSYDIPVLATDRGGLSTTAMIKVQVVDTNDNYPVFYPREYKVSVRENVIPIEKPRYPGDQNEPTPLVVVAATDRDSTGQPFGTITYAIKDGNEEEAFEIQEKTGKIFIIKPLSSTKPLHQLTIIAKDGGNRESKIPAVVHVSVLSNGDPNSAPPVFSQRQYNFKVYENVKSGTIVGTVSAKNDAKDSSNISYVIYSGDPDGYFTIDSAMGVITVRSTNIDHEKHSFLMLNIQAFSGRTPGPYRYGHTQVNVTILDENDNSPIFVTNNLKISVPENTFAHNVTILVAHALDFDSGIFGRIRYSLSNAEHNLMPSPLPFSIDPNSGAVSLNTALDFELMSQYKFKITATDGANLSSDLFVEVLVQDSNDNEPVFAGTTGDPRIQYKVNVLENIGVNSQFFQMKATDADTGNNARLTYSLVTNTDSHPFGIFPNNGMLYIKEILDRESKDKYEITIKVTDHGSPTPLSNVAVMVINIIDVNDNRPHWLENSYVFTIVENTAVGTLIGKITATDPDLGNNASLRYNISDSQTSELSVFQLNPITGEIYLKSTIDRELKDKYEFNVEVRDQGTPQPLYSEDKAIVYINILDVNDNRPTFEFAEEIKPVTVSLGSPTGVIVATVKAYDPDFGENGTVYYSFVEEHDIFDIDRNSGAISTKTNIKEITSYKLSLLATDGAGKKSKVKILNIDVTQKKLQNFIYETADIHTLDVIESVAIGQEIGSFVVQTSKTNDHNTDNSCRNGFSTYYSSFTNENIPFLLDSQNGPNLKLIVSNPLDFETKDKYNLITCVDTDQCSLALVDNESITRGTKNCKQIIKININIIDDSNDCNPFPMQSNMDLYEIKIPLNNLNKYRRLTDVLHLNRTNCENIKYEITSPLIADDVLKRLFSINGNILQFRPFDQSMIQKLLHEEFVMTLLAKKGDQTYQSIPVRVRMLSSDKRIGNIGFINEKYIEIDEDCCKVGSNILQARINVSHEDFIIKYVLNNYNTIHSDSEFSLNSETGFLSINREFDYERRQEYKINITALVHDIKGPLISVSTIVTIKVLNCNDESPVFVRKVYEKEVMENVNLNALLLQVEAKDSDDFGYSNLTYLIPEGYIYSDYFTLNRRNGELKLIKQLDRELYESFNIPIYAFDENLKHYALTFARIKLIDVNDNIPYFLNTNYEIKIPESISPGTLFHTAIAIDKDLHGLGASKVGLNYRILSGNTANKFSLHAQRGELSTNAALDREKQNIYHLVVEVSDSLYSSNCNITIELTDVNDNAPIFDKTNYYAIIDNTISDYTNVVTVRAIDSDGDQVLYAINITNEFSNHFNIDSKSGEITVHTPSLTFLAEMANSNVFIFDVLAIEIGSAAYESHTSRATVHVTLLNNVNNLMPKLKSYPYIISVDGFKGDYRVGHEIGTIELISGQTSTQSDNFIFRVVNNGDGYHSFMDYFNIHSQSGAIVVKRPLNNEYYEAIIEVSRGSNTQLATRVLLQVFIGGIDSNKNVNVMPFKVDLNENQPIGTEIINLGIRSRTYHQKYLYYFAYSTVNYSHFSLNQNTGVISLQESLDYESKPSIIELIVFGRKPHNSIEGQYFNVTIELNNVDDNAPQFTQKHYISSIKEGEPTGSLVLQISAIDIDNNKQSMSGRKPVTYHILEGNHDNAFSIDPPGSGIIRTNIVLDREIRDHYILKIVANDAINNDGSQTSDSHSNFQLSSHCTLEIIVIDVNDNVPVFPPYQEISISENEEVGALISTLTANDVDTFPMLTYHKQRTNQLSDSEDLFDIGLYTGKITLKSRLSETNSRNQQNITNQYYLNIASSDSIHTVETQVLINVKRSVSSQKPIFTNDSNFYVEIDSEDNKCVLHLTNCDIFRVTVQENKVINKKIIYSLGQESGKNGFYIDQYRGIIYNNKTLKFRNSKIFNLIVFAKYMSNELQNQASLVIRVLGTNNYHENKRDRTFNIETDMSQIGSTALKLPKLNRNYVISGGNANKNFVILRGNELVLTKKPLKEEYSLRITPNNNNQNNSILVNVKIKSTPEDKSTHNAFKSTIFDVEINENEPIGTEVQTLKPVSNSDKIKYRLFSGNELTHFRINENNGIIYLNDNLNFESVNNYRLGVVAEVSVSDSQTVNSFAIININVLNVNEHCPKFPIPHYKTIVDENVAIGTKVIKLNAFDLDNDSLNYTIIKLIDAMSPFIYDYKSGYLVTSDQIDYESIEFSPPVYKLLVRAVDTGVGLLECNSIETLLEIQIGSVDEYAPRFTSESYQFKGITSNGISHVKVGQVLASDADSGPDGKVVYTLRSSSPTNTVDHFSVNSTSGTIFMSTAGLDFQRHFSLIISASSGRHNSMNALTVVDVNLSIVSESSDINGVIKAEDSTSATASNSTSLPGWILFLIVLLMLIAVVLLVSIVVIRLHQHQQQQHLMSDHVRHIGPHNIGSLLRKIGPVGATDPNLSTYHSHHTSHYGSAPPAPPCYNDVTLSSSGALGSAEGHSASSGRGSAEDEDEVEADMDDVDEEIRMINENGNYYGEGEDSDVTTTAEYLARLGVINHHEEDREESSTNLEDEEEDDVVLDQLGNISSPNRLNSIRGQHRNRVITGTQSDDWPQMCGSLSSIVHSEEELSGSYNWDYLQHWGPKYQPLASVFAEIARLKASNGEHEDMSSIEAQIAVESGSTRSSSTASSTHHQNHPKTSHRHHLGVHMSNRVSHSSPSMTTPINSINTGFQSLSPLNASPNIEKMDLNNGLTVDEEIRI